MCAIFHAGDLTSGTENNVVATCLVRLDNASRNQVTRCPVVQPTSRAGIILESQGGFKTFPLGTIPSGVWEKRKNSLQKEGFMSKWECS